MLQMRLYAVGASCLTFGWMFGRLLMVPSLLEGSSHHRWQTVVQPVGAALAPPCRLRGTAPPPSGALPSPRLALPVDTDTGGVRSSRQRVLNGEKKENERETTAERRGVGGINWRTHKATRGAARSLQKCQICGTFWVAFFSTWTLFRSPRIRWECVCFASAKGDRNEIVLRLLNYIAIHVSRYNRINRDNILFNVCAPRSSTIITPWGCVPLNIWPGTRSLGEIFIYNPLGYTPASFHLLSMIFHSRHTFCHN